MAMGKESVKISFTVPESIKGEMRERVEKGEYKSLSDLMRRAVYRLLDEEREDILRERSFRRFIEELS
ncbi:MAG: ribbon-helix-helix protein, CopG family [Methanobacteriota archaeon]|nr:MAG: ribbon-helix-helix protein, CopG family [Euryarchaeota archaeon]